MEELFVKRMRLEPFTALTLYTSELSLLSEIKSEFGKFGTALDKVQKKLSEANNVIDQAGVRRRAVERRLSKVEELPKAKELSGALDKVL